MSMVPDCALWTLERRLFVLSGLSVWIVQRKGQIWVMGGLRESCRDLAGFLTLLTLPSSLRRPSTVLASFRHSTHRIGARTALSVKAASFLHAGCRNKFNVSSSSKSRHLKGEWKPRTAVALAIILSYQSPTFAFATFIHDLPPVPLL
ncbi:hypothetical protein SISSUDRAFT_1067081 [Sistotremastrum suecicum HHB10207 ss-3]|uniref:Uncharacterized protein n=1 Tax=Sistotremastrum suecicum HHB10207 ss-3 TaxID=1314776 RepID=A0A165XJG8_9AGAM|nr:hypothetical protein SISSUDRAFT_1067081 [Sistotremastrum suecicum HHB10207 ss-3]